LSALDAGLSVCAAANITGGGITFNLDRVLPDGLDAEVSFGSWEVPPVIQHLASRASLDTEDLLRTFNMGIGFALVCREDAVEPVIEHFKPFEARRIGRIIKAADPSAPGKVVYINL